MVDIEEFKKVLKRRARGYTKAEVVEEYTLDKDDGKMVLSKKKISKKYIPPDVMAIRLLMSMEDNNKNQWSDFTDEQLDEYKNKLLTELGKQREDL